jgi:dolichyl-phosphate beta-glucosyltransferase
LILFVDADGASKFSDFGKLEKALQGKELAVAIGSRAHMVKTEAVVKVSFSFYVEYFIFNLFYIFFCILLNANSLHASARL